MYLYLEMSSQEILWKVEFHHTVKVEHFHMHFHPHNQVSAFMHAFLRREKTQKITLCPEKFDSNR